MISSIPRLLPTYTPQTIQHKFSTLWVKPLVSPFRETSAVRLFSNIVTEVNSISLLIDWMDKLYFFLNGVMTEHSNRRNWESVSIGEHVRERYKITWVLSDYWTVFLTKLTYDIFLWLFYVNYVLTRQPELQTPYSLLLLSEKKLS